MAFLPRVMGNGPVFRLKGSLLIRLPITKRSVTVAYRIFVPFTAAGQRGFLTPLPQIHPDLDYKDMLLETNMILIYNSKKRMSRRNHLIL